MVQTKPNNLILASLATKDRALLAPLLEPVSLSAGLALEDTRRAIKSVYFPTRGFAAVMANGNKMPIQIGLIGREGMTGLALVLGANRSVHETSMATDGDGYCVSSTSLRAAMTTSASLRASLLLAVNAFINQISATAVANGRAKIDERVARLLLLADDRTQGGELQVTHNHLARLLAVRRSGVTITMQALERSGLISTRRGYITIVDRKGLEKSANGYYTG